jgi:uncharacterized Rossmann fold enzyme
MDMNEWRTWYVQIVNALGYNQSKDYESAEILSKLIHGRQLSIDFLKNKLMKRPALIVGAGPSLEIDLEKIADTNILDKMVIVAADGATSALIKISNIIPDIIVTDLDGQISDILFADKEGASIVIHSHGDNIPQIKKYVSDLKNVFGTTQTDSLDELYNFGGFTDGDRAVFMAENLGSAPIGLIGMDLGDTTGRFSKLTVPSIEIKRKKLRFAKQLLEWLAENTYTMLYNLTNSGQEIVGFPRISPAKFEEILNKSGF